MTGAAPASRALRALMPPPDAPDHDYPAAFRAMADLLLNRATLVAGGQPHRFTEIELYYLGGQHPDDFTHCDPIQVNFGVWYFHRAGEEYRGGTYKGLDIAIGHDGTHGGILIRGIEQLSLSTTRIDGPSLVVDHLLAMNRSPSIRELVSRFDIRIDAPESPAESPLYVTVEDDHRGLPVYESPRVGLTLKRGDLESRRRFIARPYRFLTEPDRIKKGKAALAVALHHRGEPPEAIARLTGSPLASVLKYTALFDEGKRRSPEEFAGNMPVEDMLRLFGACHAEMG